MKIHSKFSDYYDRVLAHGIDTSIHYVRDTRIADLSDMEWSLPEGVHINSPRHEGIGSHGTQIIGFCGVLYPYMPLLEGYTQYGVYGHQYRTHHLYFPDETEQFAQIIGESWRTRHWRQRHINDELKGARDYLSNRIADDRPFVEFRAPVFLIRPNVDPYIRRSAEIEINPCLKDLGFFKVKDPFTAFQEISGYLGNQLVQRKEPDDIADKYRVAQHGFDKWSFRKHKDQKSLDNSQQKR